MSRAGYDYDDWVAATADELEAPAARRTSLLTRSEVVECVEIPELIQTYTAPSVVATLRAALVRAERAEERAQALRVAAGCAKVDLSTVLGVSADETQAVVDDVYQALSEALRADDARADDARDRARAGL